MLSLRPAEVKDGPIAAELLAETMGGFGVAALGLGKKDLELSALQKWFSSAGNRFSYQHTTLAEADGSACGLLLGFPGNRLTALELGCARHLFCIYGFFGAFGMVWRNKVLGGTNEADNNEYLLAHLAVDSAHRRKGIGAELIHKAVDAANVAGFSRLVLEVEIGNDPALKLYQKSGFEILHTTEFKRADLLNCRGFHKMLKIIKGESQ